MSDIDPRDLVANKPDRNPDITKSGEGAPPHDLPDWDREDALYRELFFDGLPTKEYPMGWWALNVWLKSADDVQPL